MRTAREEMLLMNRHATKWFVMVAILITAGAVAALSHAAESSLELSDSWVRPTLGAGRTTAAYVTITNAGTSADRLIAAEVPNATAVEIHTAGMSDGVMRMRRVEGVDIASGGTIQLAPGGLHIMVIGLTEPITIGDQVELTLVFEKAGTKSVTANATLTPPASADHSEMEEMNSDGDETSGMDMQDNMHQGH